MNRDDVKRAREELGLTLELLAAQLGVNYRSIIRWEKGTSRPRGAVVAALQQLLEEKRGKEKGEVPPRKRNEIRFGICCEFLDTTLPLVCQPFLLRAYNANIQLIFMPVPWDDRCLFALMQKVIDIVIYNEYCTRRFAETVGYHLSIARRPFPSGAFYIACRLAPGQRPPPAENKEARVKKVIEALISKSSAVVIPPADMRHSVQLLLNKLRQSNRLFGLEIPSQEETEQRWLTMAPGEGLSFIQRPNVWFTDRTILFVGGQDQRAALELGSEEVMIVTQEDIKSVTKIDLPSELQVNRLVSREPTLAEGLDLDQLAEEYERSRTLLRDCEEERWNVALWEFARWHALYNTRFLGRAYSDVIGSVRALTREFVEAQKWLPENARLRYPTPAA